MSSILEPMTDRCRRNRVSVLSQLSPFLKLPKYFDSKWSYAKYRLPAASAHIALSSALSSSAPLSATADLVEDDRCVVGWIEAPATNPDVGNRTEYQLVALTYSGGWYRLALPAPSLTSTPISKSPPTSRASASPPSTPKLRRRSADAGPSSPRSSAPRAPSVASSAGRGRGSEANFSEAEREHTGSDCSLVEYRRYGTWDGWA